MIEAGEWEMEFPVLFPLYFEQRVQIRHLMWKLPSWAAGLGGDHVCGSPFYAMLPISCTYEGPTRSFPSLAEARLTPS